MLDRLRTDPSSQPHPPLIFAMSSVPPPSIPSPAPSLPRMAVQEGQLLILLVAGFYVLFTLLPDSNSLMVSWPWVFLWQIALATPILWWIWQLWYQRHWQSLGLGLDRLAAIALVGLIISPLFAEFPNQARWNSWAAIGFLAALYALNAWLRTPQRRLKLFLFQGYLNLAFILVSLGLWMTQTLVPELARLGALEQVGLKIGFNFEVLELRNWAPIGHQNYVAGYLLLALPILAGLSRLQTGWRRWMWLTGIALGLIDLYTTSSKGGWLGLLGLAIATYLILWFRRALPRLWLALGGLGGLLLLLGLVLGNNRLQSFVSALSTGQASGELAYRLITNLIGWRIGNTHLWTGAGPGSVPLLFQQYRPAWAGREAELAYQLHSTPAQVWAELGLWGMVLLLLLIVLLLVLAGRLLQAVRQHPEAICHSDRLLLGSIYAGLMGYGIMSLTDYQLDNLCISGSLVIFLSCLSAIGRETLDPPRTIQRSTWAHGLGWVGLGVMLAAGMWLAPIHQAWYLSSQGFAALQAKVSNFDTFSQRLSQAHRLAPWEPYYPLQLGWNLGNQGLETTAPAQRQALIDSAIRQFQQGIKVSPYQEFSHSNLGWLTLGQNPALAEQSFARSAELMAAKRGVFYGLGLSLLAQKKTDLALEAFCLELLRDPVWISSPIWRSPTLAPLYQPLQAKLLGRYDQLFKQFPAPHPLNPYLHQARGGLFWWQGNFSAARLDWQYTNSDVNQALLDLAQNQPLAPAILQSNSSAAMILMRAWLKPSQRPELLRLAWLRGTQSPLDEKTLQTLLTGISRSTRFDQWIKEKSPIRQYRRQRSGFGVLSRHIDGPAPQDFMIVIDNQLVTTFLPGVLPSPFYNPDLDRALQPWRDDLIQKVRVP
jgi:uncharacterized protein involved in response to NO